MTGHSVVVNRIDVSYDQMMAVSVASETPFMMWDLKDGKKGPTEADCLALAGKCVFADGACVEDPDAEGGGGKKGGKKSYCEKKGPTEADCLALKASKKCVWADEACVEDPDAEDKKSCKGMKGKKPYCE